MRFRKPLIRVDNYEKPLIMNKIFSILTIVFILSACKKDKQVSNNSFQLNSYPINVGLSWKFYTEFTIDSAGNILNADYFDSYWSVISDTIINGIPCAKISQRDSDYNGNTFLAYSYYANKSDGFYGIAAENGGSSLFLKSTALANRNSFSLLSAFGNKPTAIDSLFIPDTSLYLLKFPSTVNDIWASHEYGIPGLVKRKWIGNAIITTSAGTFDCMKLQVMFDFDNDNQADSGSLIIYQYFSTKGLIQEERHDSLHSFNGGVKGLNQITKLVQTNF